MSSKNQGKDHKDAKHTNPSARSRYPAPFSLRLSEDERQELERLADELRAYLLYAVGRSGGHFGAGLGRSISVTIFPDQLSPQQFRSLRQIAQHGTMSAAED